MAGRGALRPRRARVAGIDAAAGLIELARHRLPEADLLLGAFEQLPWPDESFDRVAGFNVFPFAADFVAALADARRVTGSGERVAICNRGRLEDREVRRNRIVVTSSFPTGSSAGPSMTVDCPHRHPPQDDSATAPSCKSCPLGSAGATPGLARVRIRRRGGEIAGGGRE